MILNSAEALGIEHDGKHILYDLESDMTVHYEFMLYEYRQDGRTPAERFYEEERWGTDTERTILEATLEAETSLFEVDTVSTADNRLAMTDILNDGEELSVVDINLSRTAESGVLLFFRPVRYEEYAIRVRERSAIGQLPYDCRRCLIRLREQRRIASVHPGTETAGKTAEERPGCE